MSILRSIAIGAAFASAFLLSACGSGGSGAAPGTGATAKKIKIGVSVPAADHGWTAGVVWWAKEAMALHPEV